MLRDLIAELLLAAALAAVLAPAPGSAQVPAPARDSAARVSADSLLEPDSVALARASRAARDSVRRLVRRARSAETQYELLARIRAPVALGSFGGDRCDEIVGRFCLHYDPEERDEPPPAQPPSALKARDEAITALEQAARAAPAEGRVARGLVRLLVEAHRDSAALAAARRYADTVPGLWAELLLAFALHAHGDDTAAVAHFREALPQLSDKERRRLRIDPLLSLDEQDKLHHLGDTARAGYEAALWKLADPLYLTPGNEALGEHFARYVWTRMLSELPHVRGMTSWGSDLDELTFRYGVPSSRERIESLSLLSDQLGMIEHYDPAQLAFLPESLLTVGVRPTPAPGEKWTLDASDARSAYAPTTVRRVVELPLQLSRFPAGDSLVLRIDGILPLDSAARAAVDSARLRPDSGRAAPDSARVGLFVLPGPDALLRGDTAVVRTVVAAAPVRGDTAWLSLSLTLPPGQYVYSAEAIEPRSRLAGRGRHLTVLLKPAPGPALSDIVVARPFGGSLPTRRDDSALRALPQAAALAGDTLGIYAEVGSLTGGPGARYRVELVLSRTGEPPPPVRAWSWLRRRLGAGPAPQSVTLGWTGTLPLDRAAAAAPVALATDLVVPRLAPGLYTLWLRVLDGATGAAAYTDRVLLIRPRPAAPLPARPPR